MKRIILILTIFLWPLDSNAVTVNVLGRKGVQLFSTSLDVKTPTHVGHISVLSFDQWKIPYEGGTYGMRKIFDLENLMEVVSDTELKAYGWCFSIDDITPETMADQSPVIDSDSVIEWYYAYAHYKNGAWIGQCVRDWQFR